jgi:alkaline phosphatase D
MTAGKAVPASPEPLTLPLPPSMPSAPLDETKTLTRVCFGSCYAPQFKQSHVWRSILAQKPDAFLYIGDNVYQRAENGRPELRELREAYALLAADTDFAVLRSAAPVLPVWDDHDYGMNNAGAEFAARKQSEALFKHVWAIPPDDERNMREGVYFSRTCGAAGRRTQLVLLDQRYFLTPDTMLGDEQWRWLEQKLTEPAELRILASPTPVLTQAERFEGWRQWPAERERLFHIIGHSNGVVIVSGDSHVGAHYRRDQDVAYPLFELTSSSLNFPWPEYTHIPPGPPDAARISPVFWESNFGAVEVDWAKGEVGLALYNDMGRQVTGQAVALAALRGG